MMMIIASYYPVSRHTIKPGPGKGDDTPYTTTPGSTACRLLLYRFVSHDEPRPRTIGVGNPPKKIK